MDIVLEGRRVLERITWCLNDGEHWGVIGANGSGKTSFLRLVAGHLWPAPGRGARRYDFGGGALTDAVRARREIALVGHELQDLYIRRGWNFRVLDVVLSGLFRTDVPRRAPLPGERREARTILRRLDLVHLADRSFLELSRGEQRRVLIARGLAQRPRALLLDEPASGLDRAARQALDALVSDIAARMTLVGSAHSAEQLPPVFRRQLLIEAGRAREQPRPPVSSPRTPVDAGTAVGVIGAAAAAAGAGVAAKATATAPPTTRATRATRAGAEVPLIEVSNADVWLGSRLVLTGVSWSLRPAEHWLVTGGNGAGKSTFLRLLHGQLRPARGGRIRWPALGDPANVWTLRRLVAWVAPELQAAYRYPSTVRQCVASGIDSSIGLVRRLSPAETGMVEELLQAFGLEALATRRLVTLSYGQLRRTLIARALVNRPRVLLLDEPWEGLDAETISFMDEHLGEIIARGTQLVCATHLARAAGHVTGRGAGHVTGGSTKCFTHRLELRAGRASAIVTRSDDERHELRGS